MTKILLAFALLFATFPHAARAKTPGKQVSDDLIYDNVKRKLAVDADVKGGALEIEVKEGVVTLRGNVDSEKRKAKAEKLAHKVNGVKDVDNQIKVVQK